MGLLDGLPAQDYGATVGKSNGAAIGMGVGVGQLIQAHQAKKLADANMPSLVDSGQSAMLSELNQKRKSIDTGSQFAAGMNAIDETTAGTNNAITQNTGGDVAGTVAALISSARAGNTAKNQVLGQAGQQQEFYTGMYGNLINDMASRRLDLQMSEHQQKLAEWAQYRKKGMENLLMGVGQAQSQIGQALTKATTPMPKKIMDGMGGQGGMGGGGGLPPGVTGGMAGDSALPAGAGAIEGGGAAAAGGGEAIAGLTELAPLLLV